MKKTTALLSASLVALCAFAAPAAQAAGNGWQWLPAVNDPSWKPEASVAVTGNRTDPGTGPSATGWGVDVNLNCGLVQSPDNRIRTHVNISHTNKNGTSVNAFELSPRYTVPLGDGLSVGVGPSLGLFRVNTPTASGSLPGLGVAGGVNYRSGMLYTGFDVRYHSTATRNGVDHDPLTFGAKVGVNF